jgi:hypothetical protein
MIILSDNCHRLANPTKNSSIRRLSKIHDPTILLLQETMIGGDKEIKSFSASYIEWEFLSLDYHGKSGGILTRWKKISLKLINSWAMPSVLVTLFLSNEISIFFLFMNIYGPYLERKDFWNKIFQSPLPTLDRVLIRGDLNFTLGDCDM